MITASVQQTSQTIEIKGAPPAALVGPSGLGEEFRIAFSANVRDNAVSASAKTVDLPGSLQPTAAGETPDEGNASQGGASYKALSSEQPQKGPPVQAKIAISASQGSPAKASASILAAGKKSVGPFTNASAGDEAAPATSKTEMSSSANGFHTASTGDVSLTSPLKHEVKLTAGDEAQPGAATEPVKISPSTATAKGTVGTHNVLADVATTGAASAKQPSREGAIAASQSRKSGTVPADKSPASSTASQISQATLHSTAAVFASTPELLASSTAVPQVPARAVAAEPPRVSELASAQLQSSKTYSATSGKEVAGTASGDGRFEAVLPFATKDGGGAQPGAQRETSTEAAIQAATGQAQTVQTAPARQRDRDAGGDATIEGRTSSGTRQSVPIASPSNRSTDGSERISVSTAVPGGTSLDGADATIKLPAIEQSGTELPGTELHRTVEPRGISAATSNGIQESGPQVLSKLAPAAASSAIAKQQFAKSNAHPGADSVGETKVAIEVEFAAAVLDGSSTVGLIQSADVKSAHALVDSSAAAGEGLRPVELSISAIAVSPSPTATGKITNAKRPGDERASAPVTQQSPTGAADAAVVPVIIANSSKESVPSVAAIAGGTIAAPLAHSAAAVLAAPSHAGGTTVSASPNSIGASREVGVEGALAAQSSTVTQSPEPHRTLLATPTALEVGVPSGTQGWLKIRAEVGDQGEVKASLDAVSASGRELLHSQLPALNAFLHSEQMPVTASVAQRSLATDGSSAGMPTTSEGAAGFASSNGSLPGDGGQRQAGEHLSSAESGTIKSYDALGGLSDPAATFSGLQLGTSTESGQWLNVRV